MIMNDNHTRKVQNGSTIVIENPLSGVLKFPPAILFTEKKKEREKHKCR